MKNVLEWLEKSAAKYTEKIAYSDSEHAVTFGETLRTAKWVGSLLHRQSRNSTKPIPVFSKRAATTPELFLGVCYAGRAYAPVDAGLPVHRIAKILDNIAPNSILCDRDSEATLKTILNSMREEDGDDWLTFVNILCIDFNQFNEAEIDETALREIRRDMIATDPLYIIHTSGSTGNPKGVMTCHESVITYIDAYTAVMGIGAEDVLGNQSPLDYIAAIRDIYIPLKTGASTVIIPKQYFMNPNALFTYMNERGVTAVGWSVSAFTIPLSLGAFEEVGLTTLRKICFSGSVMPAKVLKAWQEHLLEATFVNQYGPTEATASCTYYAVDHVVSEGETLPIGRAYDGYRVFLLDHEELAVIEKSDIGRTGEICVAGPILALGYYNQPEKTAEAFVMNPCNAAYPERIYKTGDYGAYGSDGNLYFHGRMDRQIKHMGHRVELDEVEAAANLIEGVSAAACIYNREKEQLVLYYKGSADKRAVAQGLRREIPDFMVPRKILQIEAMPHLANGKTDYKTLEEMR